MKAASPAISVPKNLAGTMLIPLSSADRSHALEPSRVAGVMLRGGICGALPVSANPSLSNLRVLVAEDESLIALNLEMTLEQFGWEVIGPIWRVRDIVEAIREHRPDGALLDINLRGQQVFDVLAEVMDLGVPIVLTSGYDDETLFPAAFRGLPRIAKPFNEAELHRVCCRTMAPPRLI